VRPASRPSFFRLPTLALMGGLAAGAFYLLYPREGFFDALNNAPKPDSVSLAYMDILQKRQKVDGVLLASLAENQIRAGGYQKGVATLMAMSEIDDIPFARLKSVLPLLTPDDQLRLVPRFIERDRSGDHLWLHRLLGKAQLATSQPSEAADTLAWVLPTLPKTEQPEARLELVRRYLAAGKPGQALNTFKAGGLPQNNKESLSLGIRLAEFTGDINSQIQWLDALSRIETDAYQTLQRLFALQLGENRLEAAARTGERLLTYEHRLSPDQKANIARSFEWTGRYAKAQDLWRKVYKDTGEVAAFERARILARERFDWSALAAILTLASQRRSLTPEEWQQLADASLRQGELDASMTTLERALLDNPGNTELSGRLLTLYFNNQRFEDAIALLNAEEELSGQQRILLANLYWRTRSPEKALAVLQAPFSEAEYEDEAAHLRLDLALILDDDDALLQEYRVLVRRAPSSMDEELAQRVIGLALYFDDQATAMALAEARFSLTGNVRLLPVLAELQAGDERWTELGQTLSVWRRKDPGAGNNARYWLLLGRYYEQSNRPHLAERAYQGALIASPGNADVLESWAWLLLADTDRSNSKLRVILDQLRQQGEGRAPELFAYGSEVLAGTPGAGGYESNNRVLQVGWYQEDLDRLTIQHRYITSDYAFNDYRITASMDDLGTTDDTFYRSAVNPAPDFRFTLASNESGQQWQWTGGVGRHDRLGDNDLWAGITLRYSPVQRWQLQLEHYQGERATDSAEAWWLMGKNRTGVEARYQPWSRLAVEAGIDALSFDSAEQTGVASGHELTLGANYQLARGNIGWNIRSEYSHQRLTSLEPLDADTRNEFTQPITTGDLLTEDYERVGLGSRWYHGDPHGLFRQDAAPRWFFDVAAGYVLSSSSPDIGISTGIGWSLLGNDELALSTGYASDGLNNESRLNARMTYTLYFSDLRRSQ